VRLVVPVRVQEVHAIADDPSESVRVFDVPLPSAPPVTEKSLVSIFPLSKLILLVPLFQLSWSVHPPPEPLKVHVDAVVTELNVRVFPVLVALKVIEPVNVLVAPLAIEKLPYIFNAELPAKVIAPAKGLPIVRSAQFAVAVIVTV
jgi:hypothetical protein